MAYITDVISTVVVPQNEEAGSGQQLMGLMLQKTSPSVQGHGVGEADLKGGK